MEIKRLNVLRAYAAFLVLVSHFSNETKVFDGILGAGAGQMGVMLFFMLSGFLMSYLYTEKNFNKSSVFSYVNARCARVLPLYVFLVTASYLIYKVSPNILYEIPNLSTLIEHLFLIKGISVFWSIIPEIQYYIVFIALWYLYHKYDFLGLIIGLSILFFISYIFDFQRYEYFMFGHKYRLDVIKTFPYFIIGTFFGWFFNKISDFRCQSGYFCLVILFIPILYPRVTEKFLGNTLGTWDSMIVFSMMTLIFYIYVFLGKDSKCSRYNSVFEYLGKISYSIYLLHEPILSKLVKLSIDNLLKFILFILITLILSTLSYYFFEKPMGNWMKCKYSDYTSKS